MFSPISTNRRRSAAAFMLLGWLLALFISVAHACVPARSSHQPMPDDAAASVYQHVDYAPEDSGHDRNACRMVCDAQTSDVAKEKSFDASGLDRLVLYTSAYIVPLLPPVAFVPRAEWNHYLLHNPSMSLRFNRLTL